MSKNSSIVAIFREFFTRYPRHFGSLFLLLVVEGAVAALSVMMLVPLADFMLDPTFAKPSCITRVVIDVLGTIGSQPTFSILAALLVVSNFLKSSLEVAIRYAILRIKYAVIRGLFGDALQTFFNSRWKIFSGSDKGRLLNTLNGELNTICDTLGHLATLLAQIIQLPRRI